MLQASITGEVEKGEEPNKTYTIAFNANGGNIEKTSKQIAYNEEYGELETPTKIGYNFDGWYTEKEGGTKIISNMKYTQEENQTLYAHWTQKEYVSDGLMLHYDGISNTQSGHSNSANIWKDLSGNGNDGILNGGTWEDNCLVFDGVDDWVNCGERNYSNVTIEAVILFEEFKGNTNAHIAGNWENGGYGMEAGISSIHFNSYIGGQGTTIFCTSDQLKQTKKLYSISGGYDGNEMFLYENGSKNITNYSGTIDMPTNSTVFALGGNPSGSRCK